MMKFAILILVAFTFCLSESEGSKGQLASIAKEKYGLSVKKLKAICHRKGDCLWTQLQNYLRFSQAVEKDLASQIADLAAKDNKVSEKEYNDLIKTRCLTNVVLKDMKKYTGVLVQQCFNPKKPPHKSKSLPNTKKALSETCKKIKTLAKKKNSHLACKGCGKSTKG